MAIGLALTLTLTLLSSSAFVILTPVPNQSMIWSMICASARKITCSGVSVYNYGIAAMSL